MSYSLLNKQAYQWLLDFCCLFFQRVWLPILAMEAASKTTQSGEPIVCNNVPVSLSKRNGRYYGKLHLPLDFCKTRCIKLFNNSKDEEEDASDYLCLRYRTGKVVRYFIVFVCCEVDNAVIQSLHCTTSEEFSHTRTVLLCNSLLFYSDISCIL